MLHTFRNPLQAQRGWSRQAQPAAAAPLSPLSLRRSAGRLGRCSAVKEFQIGTVYSSGKEANWFAPQGDSKAAKGVVLFMHGFAQGPNAYYQNLQGLADAGFLVVAPVPPFGATPSNQQGSMVEYADYFYNKIVSNTLTGLPMAPEAAQNVGLLGHSVGAGLATYVAKQAAAQGRPFKAVMYMAPQTEVVDRYNPSKALKSWPKDKSTDFALQYGLKDDLAPPELSTDLKQELQDAGLAVKVSIPYPDGTHVGFEDQVVLGDAEVVPDILPWLTPLLLWLITALSSLGVPYLPYALGQIYKQRRLAAEGPDGAAGSDGSAAVGTSGGGGLLGAAKPGEERALARLDRLFGKLLVNPLDITLLEQQAARREAPRLFKGAPRPDGIGPPEEVDIASAEATMVQYIGLLTVTVAATLYLASKAFTDGEVHWLPLIGTLVTGYMTYEGVYYLRLQNYVNTVQRPDSRKAARDFFIQYLSGANRGNVPKMANATTAQQQ